MGDALIDALSVCPPRLPERADRSRNLDARMDSCHQPPPMHKILLHGLDELMVSQEVALVEHPPLIDLRILIEDSLRM